MASDGQAGPARRARLHPRRRGDGARHEAPAIGATAIQVFTKTPNQWREPSCAGRPAEEFRRALERSGIHTIVAHDSYLINLATPDPVLLDRSEASFVPSWRGARRSASRCVVSHPGNFIDDREAGMQRNADAYTALPPGRARRRSACCWRPRPGTGTALGSTFEELAALRGRSARTCGTGSRFCADTCHLYSAGYDLVRRLRRRLAAVGRAIGLESLRCLHLNDSKTPFGSRRDRHELIGEGSLGAEPFRRIMRDPRFARVRR